MPVCQYCKGTYSSQAGITKHINNGNCPGYRLKILGLQKPTHQTIININQVNINIFNEYKSEVDTKYSLFEAECKKLLSRPDAIKYLKSADADKVKQFAIGMLEYLKNNRVVSANTYDFIKGKEVEIELAADADPKQCIEYVANRSKDAAIKISKEIVNICGNKSLPADLFWDVD
jgi:hypothetical protein